MRYRIHGSALSWRTIDSEPAKKDDDSFERFTRERLPASPSTVAEKLKALQAIHETYWQRRKENRP